MPAANITGCELIPVRLVAQQGADTSWDSLNLTDRFFHGADFLGDGDWSAEITCYYNDIDLAPVPLGGAAYEAVPWRPPGEMFFCSGPLSDKKNGLKIVMTNHNQQGNREVTVKGLIYASHVPTWTPIRRGETSAEDLESMDAEEIEEASR